MVCDQVADDLEEECDGEFVDPFVDGLFAHRGSGRAAEGNSQLVERRPARTDRFQEGEVEIPGAEFPRISSDEACLSCNFIKSGNTEKRAGGE